jgi:hypothetical protein
MPEIIIPEDNKDNLPYIYKEGNEFFISNPAIPQMADNQFNGFFEQIDKSIIKYKGIIININMPYFSSNMKLVFHRLMIKLTESWFKCRPVIKWHYDEDDEETMEYGEVFQDLYKKIEFEFIAHEKLSYKK